MAWVVRSSIPQPWKHSCHPAAPFRLLWQQRHLLMQLIAREVRGRYRGSLLGSTWSLLLPVFAVTIYACVFGLIFKQRWPDESGSGWSYALLLFAGLAFFNAFVEVVQRASTIIAAQPNLVKKVVFPLEILPAMLLGAALMPLAISLLLVFVGLHCSGQTMEQAFWVLLVVPFFLMWLQGLAWFLAGVGTFLRDIGALVGALCPLLMFLTPLFYPASLIPEAYRFLVWLNPLAVVVETVRAGLTSGALPPWGALAWFATASLVTWQAGFVTFTQLRPEMADVV